LNDPIEITSKLPTDQRAALEELLFFNANQHRVRSGIQQSIEAYGEPEILAIDGGLRVRVRDLEVQSLFAVSAEGTPVGVAVFMRLADQRFVVLHLGVAPRFHSGSTGTSPVLIRLLHEIRRAARRTRGVNRIELVYKERHGGAATRHLHS
jgi:hypothetical protein